MPTYPMPLGVTAVMLPDLDFDEQLALCQELGVTHYSVRPRVIPQEQVGKPWGNWGNHKFDLTPTRLVKEGAQIAAKLKAHGMVACGTVHAISIAASDDDLKLAFEGGAAVGAGRVRVAPEPVPQGAFDYQETLKKTVAGFARAVKLAEPFKQKVVIETHCQSLATSPALALNICQNFTSQQIGTIFDLANFNFEGYVQPNLAIAVLGDYIDHVHIGGGHYFTGSYDELGFAQQTRTMGPLFSSFLHMPSWIRALHAAGRDVPLVIEDFTPGISGERRLRDTAGALKRILENL